MYRKIMGFLEAWKESEHRKPLILQGARQVGKTYSILEFGRTHYENVAYFNFETNPKLNETFDENISPDYLIPILSHIAGQTIVKEKTLIVFDEVQLCERALTSLKYFCENAPDYHIIVAGSLLGVAVNRAKFSFPVGKVDMKTLYPMDMEEFMLALGEDDLVEQIKKCFQTDTPLPSALHDAAMQLYRQYLVVGGMPECVMQFAETKDYILVRHTQDTILASYLNDMSKYNNLNEIKKTRLAYDNITVQLSKKNTRFQYKLIKKGGRASEFENAIEWLCLSGIVSQVYKVEQIKKPLENYRDIDAFKIYVSDLGLLCAKKDLASNEGITIGAMERTIGASKGVLSRAINNGTDIQAKWLSIIVENYPRYSTGWLLTGAGSMLKDDLNGIKTIDEANPSFMPTTSMNPSVGTPYYDVDFIGGFDEVFNSQVNIPATNIVIRGFEKASLWCNVTGHSMEPKINHGDIIALRQCTLNDIQYGEIYAVVLDTIRTIKILRRSPDPSKLRFIPINTEDYDEQEFDKSRIMNVFEVIGSISKFF